MEFLLKWMSRTLSHIFTFDDAVAAVGNDMLLGWISRFLSDIVVAFVFFVNMHSKTIIT